MRHRHYGPPILAYVLGAPYGPVLPLAARIRGHGLLAPPPAPGQYQVAGQSRAPRAAIVPIPRSPFPVALATIAASRSTEPRSIGGEDQNAAGRDNGGYQRIPRC